ncbi:hypothetical protein FACS1894110_09990 [Spirochaetia bacterium]|nr:hypothetical protein FACS1894110_09990 [Spirochaetia bacterium]
MTLKEMEGAMLQKALINSSIQVCYPDQNRIVFIPRKYERDKTFHYLIDNKVDADIAIEVMNEMEAI